MKTNKEKHHKWLFKNNERHKILKKHILNKFQLCFIKSFSKYNAFTFQLNIVIVQGNSMPYNIYSQYILYS